MIFLSALFFGIATLMHFFGWGSGKADVELFMLLGLLFLALSGCSWGWVHVRRPGPPA